MRRRTSTANARRGTDRRRRTRPRRRRHRDLHLFIEERPAYLPLVLPLFEAADQGKRTLITSALTLLEVLAVPYRQLDVRLAHRYEALLTRSRGIRLVDLTHDVVRTAAQLRAAVTIKTPDSLQLAAALTAGCKTFVTNDRRLPQLPELRIIELGWYVTSRR